MKKAFNKKKLIVPAVILVIILAIVAIAVFSPKLTIDRKVLEENGVKPAATAVYKEGSFDFVENDYTLIGEKGENQLYYNNSDYTIKVKNTKTGYEWSSKVTDEEYIHNAQNGATENTQSVRNKLRRLFEIGYTNFGELDERTSIAESDFVDVTLHKLENGIALDTNFIDCGIKLTVEIWLDEDGLNVRVPLEKLEETAVDENGKKKYGILSLSVLPMFGATTDNVENGFILFPDTTGGIYTIKPVTGRQNPLTSDIYFPRDFDLDDIEENNIQGIKNSIMPFFGVSRGQNGFVGYITEGEMNGYVTLNPSGAVYYLNRVEPCMNYRKSYTYLNPSGKEVTATEKNISGGDFAVHYSFVSAAEGQNVSYGNMATKLQNYLASIGRLKKTESVSEERVNTNLQMIMSTKSETMIAEILQVMTKCEDIEDLIGGLSDSERERYRVMMLGWQSSGYNINPSTGKISGSIGNVKKLSKFLSDNGIESYLVDDYVYATTDSGNFSKQSDAVYNESKLPVTNTESNQYVLNAFKEYTKLNKTILPYLDKNGVQGVGYDKLGWYVFDDYQKRVELTRQDTISTYLAILNKTHEKGMKTAVQRGNAYILSSTDYIYDLPTTGSNFDLIDYNVPFYQMVVHGYIPYSLDTPGNMAVDFEQMKLKWIETGSEPTFLFTKEMSEEFKNSKVTNAFATELDTWFPLAKEVADEFNKNLAFTGNNTITDHTKVAENVYCITYSNGNKIYVNYTNNDVTVNDVTVKGEDYVVVTKDGKSVR